MAAVCNRQAGQTAGQVAGGTGRGRSRSRSLPVWAAGLPLAALVLASMLVPPESRTQSVAQGVRLTAVLCGAGFLVFALLVLAAGSVLGTAVNRGPVKPEAKAGGRGVVTLREGVRLHGPACKNGFAAVFHDKGGRMFRTGFPDSDAPLSAADRERLKSATALKFNAGPCPDGRGRVPGRIERPQAPGGGLDFRDHRDGLGLGRHIDTHG